MHGYSLPSTDLKRSGVVHVELERFAKSLINEKGSLVTRDLKILVRRKNFRSQFFLTRISKL